VTLEKEVEKENRKLGVVVESVFVTETGFLLQIVHRPTVEIEEKTGLSQIVVLLQIVKYPTASASEVFQD